MRILNFFVKEPVRPTSRTRSRKLPLRTCAVSILSSTHRAYDRAQKFSGPSGWLFRKSARFAAYVEPCAREIKNRCLSILTLADDRILAGECAMEEYFPASAIVFDGVDGLVRAMEVFPEKAEQIVSILPALIPKAPFLHQALSYIVSWLDPWVSKPDSEMVAREMDIQMDMRSGYTSAENVCGNHSPAHDEEAGQELFSLAELLKIETKTSNDCKEVPLEKGNREDSQVERKEGDHQGQEPSPADAIIQVQGQESSPADAIIQVQGQEPAPEDAIIQSGQKEMEKAIGDGTEEGLMNDDLILDLFESGWHMNKPVKWAKGSPMTRAAPQNN